MSTYPKSRVARVVLAAMLFASVTLALSTAPSSAASTVAPIPCSTPGNVPGYTETGGATPYSITPSKAGSGDGEFSGHGPFFYGSATLQATASTLRILLYMYAEESQADWTQVIGSKTYTIYTAPPGCKINTSTLPANFDATAGLDRGGSQPLTDVGENPLSFVARYAFFTNRSGADVGYTSMKVYIKHIKVDLSQTPPVIAP